MHTWCGIYISGLVGLAAYVISIFGFDLGCPHYKAGELPKPADIMFDASRSYTSLYFLVVPLIIAKGLVQFNDYHKLSKSFSALRC